MIFGSRAITQAKRDHIASRDAALLRPLPIDPSKDDLLAVGDARDLEILSSGVVALTKGIEERKWTASDVLAVYVRSARRAQERLNCLTEVLFETAVQKAKSLDEYFEREGKLIGPLHGVPLSVKDHLPTVGAKVTLGFSGWIKNPPATQNAVIINVLEHLGAVPFVKTHIPQTMIAFECHTPLFGITKNPINTGHTPGGSSGGEAALLVADGSVVGVGSDIGGSLRIPAAYSGCYSLKPSMGRWTRSGSAKYCSGFDGIFSVFGPMARTAADVELTFNAVVNVLQPPSIGSADVGSEEGQEAMKKAAEFEALMNKFNYTELPPAPLRHGWSNPLAFAKARGKPLRIGIIYTDGFIKTSPACHRAVFESVDALKRKHGKEIELVRVPAVKVRSAEGLQIFTAILGAGGHYDKTKHITSGGDRFIRPIWMAIYLTRLPGFLYKMIFFICKWILRDPRIAMVMTAPGRKNALEYQNWVEKKHDFIGQWKKDVWDGMDLDGIIAPVHAIPALHHFGTSDLSMITAGTSLYNVMDNAVGTVPVTRVDADIDSHLPPTKRGPKIQLAWNRWNKDLEVQSEHSGFVTYNIYSRGRYNSKKMHGLPVGVQMICRPHADETALGLMRLLDDALPKSAERGGAWNVDGDASRSARGFGPGSYTTAVYPGSG
ncbi:hypothetical protein CF319_g2977 [Tilletia indica]|nr:hypothetical protein CF319_g2977 [Tilletia indica]